MQPHANDLFDVTLRGYVDGLYRPCLEVKEIVERARGRRVHIWGAGGVGKSTLIESVRRGTWSGFDHVFKVDLGEKAEPLILGEKTLFLVDDCDGEDTGGVLRSLADQPSVIFTSRRAHTTPLALTFDVQLECIGFSSTQMNRFVTAYGTSYADAIRSHLSKNPVLGRQCKIPLNLYLLCTEWTRFNEGGPLNIRDVHEASENPHKVVREYTKAVDLYERLRENPSETARVLSEKRDFDVEMPVLVNLSYLVAQKGPDEVKKAFWDAMLCSRDGDLPGWADSLTELSCSLLGVVGVRDCGVGGNLSIAERLATKELVGTGHCLAPWGPAVRNAGFMNDAIEGAVMTLFESTGLTHSFLQVFSDYVPLILEKPSPRVSKVISRLVNDAIPLLLECDTPLGLRYLDVLLYEPAMAAMRPSRSVNILLEKSCYSVLGKYATHNDADVIEKFIGLIDGYEVTGPPFNDLIAGMLLLPHQTLAKNADRIVLLLQRRRGISKEVFYRVVKGLGCSGMSEDFLEVLTEKWDFSQDPHTSSLLLAWLATEMTAEPALINRTYAKLLTIKGSQATDAILSLQPSPDQLSDIYHTAMASLTTDPSKITLVHNILQRLFSKEDHHYPTAVAALRVFVECWDTAFIRSPFIGLDILGLFPMEGLAGEEVVSQIASRLQKYTGNNSITERVFELLSRLPVDPVWKTELKQYVPRGLLIDIEKRDLCAIFTALRGANPRALLKLPYYALKGAEVALLTDVLVETLSECDETLFFVCVEIAGRLPVRELDAVGCGKLFWAVINPLATYSWMGHYDALCGVVSKLTVSGEAAGSAAERMLKEEASGNAELADVISRLSFENIPCEVAERLFKQWVESISSGTRLISLSVVNFAASMSASSVLTALQLITTNCASSKSPSDYSIVTDALNLESLAEGNSILLAMRSVSSMLHMNPSAETIAISIVKRLRFDGALSSRDVLNALIDSVCAVTTPNGAKTMLNGISRIISSGNNAAGPDEIARLYSALLETRNAGLSEWDSVFSHLDIGVLDSCETERVFNKCLELHEDGRWVPRPLRLIPFGKLADGQKEVASRRLWTAQQGFFEVVQHWLSGDVVRNHRRVTEICAAWVAMPDTAPTPVNLLSAAVGNPDTRTDLITLVLSKANASHPEVFTAVAASTHPAHAVCLLPYLSQCRGVWLHIVEQGLSSANPLIDYVLALTKHSTMGRITGVAAEITLREPSQIGSVAGYVGDLVQWPAGVVYLTALLKKIFATLTDGSVWGFLKAVFRAGKGLFTLSLRRTSDVRCAIRLGVPRGQGSCGFRDYHRYEFNDGGTLKMLEDIVGVVPFNKPVFVPESNGWEIAACDVADSDVRSIFGWKDLGTTHVLSSKGGEEVITEARDIYGRVTVKGLVAHPLRYNEFPVKVHVFGAYEGNENVYYICKREGNDPVLLFHDEVFDRAGGGAREAFTNSVLAELGMISPTKAVRGSEGDSQYFSYAYWAVLSFFEAYLVGGSTVKGNVVATGNIARGMVLEQAGEGLKIRPFPGDLGAVIVFVDLAGDKGQGDAKKAAVKEFVKTTRSLEKTSFQIASALTESRKPEITYVSRLKTVPTLTSFLLLLPQTPITEKDIDAMAPAPTDKLALSDVAHYISHIFTSKTADDEVRQRDTMMAVSQRRYSDPPIEVYTPRKKQVIKAPTGRCSSGCVAM